MFIGSLQFHGWPVIVQILDAVSYCMRFVITIIQTKSHAIKSIWWHTILHMFATFIHVS